MISDGKHSLNDAVKEFWMRLLEYMGLIFDDLNFIYLVGGDGGGAV